MFKHYVLELAHRHGRLVAIQILVAMANTLANSFALIYLVHEGASYVDCAVFVLITVATSTALVAFASRTIVKRFSSSMVTSLVVLSGYYILLMFLDDWMLIVIPPVLFGIYIVTFWIPYNAVIMHITSRAKRGAAVGSYFMIFPLVGVAMPAAGGLAILLMGYQGLFAIAAVLAATDLFYILGFRVFRDIRSRIIIPELLQSLKLNLVGNPHIDLDLKAIDRRLTAALFAEGIQDGVFWIAVPLVTLEYAKDEVSVGGYLSLFILWGSIMTIALGFLSDRMKDRSRIVRVGAIFGAIAVFSAAMGTSAAHYASSMSVSYFFIAMIPSFLFAMLLDRMERFKKKGVLVREFLLDGGRVVGASAVLMFLLLGIRIDEVMIVASFALLVIALVSKRTVTRGNGRRPVDLALAHK
jgi:hypothetical protein